MREEPKHGIEAAYYANGPEGFIPHLECCCGWITSRSVFNWEDAGAEFDAHLKETK